MVVCITFLVCSTINPRLVEHLTVYDDSFGFSLLRYMYHFFSFFFSHSCFVAYTEISAATRTLSLPSGLSRAGGASMHSYTTSLTHAYTYTHRKYRGTLCTRSDRYICSLFRRVFVFRGTLFTTG